MLFAVDFANREVDEAIGVSSVVVGTVKSLLHLHVTTCRAFGKGIGIVACCTTNKSSITSSTTDVLAKHETF